MNTKAIKLCAVLLLSAATGTSAHAGGSWNGVQFGGFASQGYLINSGNNDYLGETSEGTFDFREYAANASYAKGEWRIGAQVFGQKLGDYGNDEIALDWATIDYQPAQWLGFRAGRVKTPRGLYNEALDVDAIRPFVLMPQSVYDSRLRDFNASFDGGMLFGNVAIGDSNSIDYKAYYGNIPIALDSGANDYFNNDFPFPNTLIEMDSVTGGSLFWNTALDGLKLGYSASEFKDFNVHRVVTIVPGNPTYFKKTPAYKRKLLSAEYASGDWVWAAEVGTDKGYADAGLLGLPTSLHVDAQSKYRYLSVTRRLNEKFELGAYYSHSKDTSKLIGADVISPDLEQTDWAFSVRYDFNYNWLMKVEAHYMDGAGKIFSTPAYPQPLELRDNSWMLFAAKTTYTF